MAVAVPGDFGGQCGNIALLGGADLDRKLVTQVIRFGGLGDPTLQLGATCRADPIYLLVRPAVLRYDFGIHPPGFVHALEQPIDLLVGGALEEADRFVESACQFIPRPGMFGEGDEKRMFECHAESMYATKCLCN